MPIRSIDGPRKLEQTTGQLDRCDRCGCGRVAEDDDGRHWKTLRGRRACGACVFELALAMAQRERWWLAANGGADSERQPSQVCMGVDERRRA